MKKIFRRIDFKGAMLATALVLSSMGNAQAGWFDDVAKGLANAVAGSAAIAQVASDTSDYFKKQASENEQRAAWKSVNEDASAFFKLDTKLQNNYSVQQALFSASTKVNMEAIKQLAKNGDPLAKIYVKHGNGEDVDWTAVSQKDLNAAIAKYPGVIGFNGIEKVTTSQVQAGLTKNPMLLVTDGFDASTTADTFSGHADRQLETPYNKYSGDIAYVSFALDSTNLQKADVSAILFKSEVDLKTAAAKPLIQKAFSKIQKDPELVRDFVSKLNQNGVSINLKTSAAPPPSDINGMLNQAKVANNTSIKAQTLKI